MVRHRARRGALLTMGAAPPYPRSRLFRLLPWTLVLLAAVFWSSSASAFPFMIRHQFAGCVPCHADPSGGGLLTEYGRAQGDLLMRMRYGAPAGQEPSKTAGFAFGVPLPDWLLLGGAFRNAVLVSKLPAQPVAARFIEMQTDLRA